MKHTDLAQDYFERHSQSDECFITSDGRVFHTYGHATSFAQEHQLQDQTIETYKRAQSDVAENATVEDETEKIEELKAFDIETGDYNAVKAFVKFFKIETADQKKETLIAALTEFKNTLNQ